VAAGADELDYSVTAGGDVVDSCLEGRPRASLEAGVNRVPAGAPTAWRT